MYRTVDWAVDNELTQLTTWRHPIGDCPHIQRRYVEGYGWKIDIEHSDFERTYVQYLKSEKPKYLDAEIIKRDDGRVSLWARLSRDCAAIMDMASLLYTSPSPRDGLLSRMPSSA